MKTKTRLNLGFGGQILFAAILGIYVLLGLNGVKQQFSFVVEHDAPVIENARYLSKLVVDMETGQRGFCIVQKEAFLAPYIAGVKKFAVLIEKEKKLVSDNPDQVEALERIEHLVHEWQEKAAKPEIAMARKVAAHTIDAQQLQDILRQGVGKELMDRFMALGHEIEVSFSDRGDWESAFAVKLIEKCMADREDSQRGFLITGKDVFLEKYIDGEQKKLPENFARLRTIISERGRDDELSIKIDRLEQLTYEWTEKAAEPEIAARREMNENPESLKDVAALLEAGTGKVLIDEIRKKLDRFIEIEEELTARRYDNATETSVKTRIIAAILLVLALCFGVTISVVTSRAISIPLAKLARGAKRVGSGDLDTRVDIESSDEIGDLSRVFNNMTRSLKKASSMRKLAEEEREKLQDQLLQTQKMDAIGTLAGGIAHQFNNALFGITGNIVLLEMDFPGDKTVANYTRKMNTSAFRMAQLTAQLLAYARGGKYQAKTISVNNFVDDTLSNVHHVINPGIEIKTDLAPGILNVKADQTQMQMMLAAILTNASEAIEGDGIIRITTKEKEIDAAFAKHNPELKTGPYAHLIVEDNGKGMDNETRNRIFEPFFSTNVEGRGLGMASAFGIVRNHDGWISVYSEAGRGTAVSVYLPLMETQAEAALKSKIEPIKGTGTILIIEDEEMIMDVSQALLERLGYKAMGAMTGKEAVNIAQTYDGEIDLAILDMVLPDMDGKAIYPLIMEARPDLKVLVCSGYSIDGPAREVIDAGAQDFIQKPFTMADLSEKLKNVLGGEQ